MSTNLHTEHSGCPVLHNHRFPSAEWNEDPFSIYRDLRTEAPVYHPPNTNIYLVTTWDDIVHVTQHPEVFSSRMNSDPKAYPMP